MKYFAFHSTKRLFSTSKVAAIALVAFSLSTVALAADPVPAAKPQAATPAVAKPAAQPQAKPAAPAQGQQQAKPAAQPQGQQQAAPVNALTQAVMKAGVKKCANRVNQFSNFLTSGAQTSGATMFIPSAGQDTQLFSTSLEIGNPTLGTAYATASYAPTATGCGGVYESVIYWPTGCADTAAKQFQGLKQTGMLSKQISIYQGNGSTRVFLMPAGTGCVSIKKEIVW